MYIKRRKIYKTNDKCIKYVYKEKKIETHKKYKKHICNTNYIR